MDTADIVMTIFGVLWEYCTLMAIAFYIIASVQENKELKERMSAEALKKETPEEICKRFQTVLWYRHGN